MDTATIEYLLPGKDRFWIKSKFHDCGTSPLKICTMKQKEAINFTTWRLLFPPRETKNYPDPKSNREEKASTNTTSYKYTDIIVKLQSSTHIYGRIEVYLQR